MLQPHYDNGESAAPVVARIVQDAKTLLEQEFHLAKVEILDQVHELRKTTAKFMFGLVAVTLGVVFMAITIEHLLEIAGLESWVSFGITGALFILVGAVILKLLPGREQQIGVKP